MADDLNLSAKIVADVNGFIANIAKMRSEIESTVGSTKSLDAQLNKLEKTAAGVATAVSGNAASHVQLSKATATATAQQVKNVGVTNTATSAHIRERYALYDVSATYGVLSAALLGASAVAIKTGADFESAFTNVERTLDNGVVPAQVQKIRASLVDLSTTIPKSFDEITQIATLGNELGVTAGNLVGFTQTIAQFSTVTGISAEQSALAFGKLGNLLGITSDKYVNLGSAISYVGRTLAATPDEIIANAENIAAAARGAGFAADQVIGLSGALASLKVPPEQSRGSLTLYFNAINKAVISGGADLENFAKITGLTTQKFTELVKSGKGGPEILQRFAQGLNSADPTFITGALDQLGLSNIRVDNTFRRLASGTALYDKAQKDSASSYAAATELATQYAKVADDLNTQFKELVNSVNALINTLTGGLVPGLSGAVAILVKFVNGLRQAADNPLIKTIAGLTLGITTLAGVFLAYRAAVALTIASTYALTTAQGSLAGASGLAAVKGALGAILPTLNTTTVATETATVATSGYTLATNSAGVASKAFGAVLSLINPLTLAIGLGIASVALLSLGRDAVTAASGLQSIKDAGTTGLSGTQLFSQIVTAQTTIDSLNSSVDDLYAKNQSIGAVFADFFNSGTIDTAVQVTKDADAALASYIATADSSDIAKIQNGIAASGLNIAKVAPQTAAALRAVAAEIARTNPYVAYLQGTDSATTSTANLGKAAGGAAKKVRTLIDYAGDLGKVFSRAFDIRFGSQSAIDSVTTSFEDLASRIRDAETELLKLTADKNVKEYFLSVANAYGDTLRAGILTGEIADINSKIADSQANATTELTGNTKGAIKNRKTITDLVKGYDDYIQALAESGANQDTLNSAVAQSKTDFIAQATALGYSNTQLQPYVASFNDMATAIARVPRNITVTANADPAIQALNELEAAAKSAGGAIGSIPSLPLNDSKAYRQAALGELIMTRIAYMGQLRAAGNISGAMQIASNIDDMRAALRSGNFWSGGYTGPGGKYQAAGVVHKGEYVVPKEQVNQRTGLPYANALGGVQIGSRGGGNGGYANGGFVSPSSMVMQLSPRDRAIMGSRGDIVIQIDGREIARAVSNVNQQKQFTGSN